jgi:Zn-dependent protease
MDINNSLQTLFILAPPFLLALTFHELAHGYVAYVLGDPTAKNAGRLTMNPLKHLDPYGVLAFIILKIGWAKPVPVNPRYFKNPQKDLLLVALAGPVSNVFLALLSALLLKVALFAPFLPSFLLNPLGYILMASIWINVMLAVFNLLPIPPLDGSKILMGFLSPQHAEKYARMEPYTIIVLLLLFAVGILGKVILPIITFFTQILIPASPSFL